MNKPIVLLLLLIAAAGAASAQQPLYDQATGASLFTDRKAYRVGDVITIVIRENAAASSNSQTQTNYKSEVSGGPGTGTLGFVNVWGLDSENKYNGDGKTQRSGQLSAEMTARIIEMLPNGHFKLEGSRSVRINGEFETIVVSGIARLSDITPDNKILSTSIADAAIAYDGKGDVGHAGSPGLFTKILNWLF